VVVEKKGSTYLRCKRAFMYFYLFLFLRKSKRNLRANCSCEIIARTMA
jgi:hypothetical protein